MRVLLIAAGTDRREDRSESGAGPSGVPRTETPCESTGRLREVVGLAVGLGKGRLSFGWYPCLKVVVGSSIKVKALSPHKEDFRNGERGVVVGVVPSS